MSKDEPWTITETHQEINRSWLNSLLNRKDEETLEEDKKRASARDMRQIQRCLMTAALYLNPIMTAGEFAQFHNKAMQEIR